MHNWAVISDLHGSRRALDHICTILSDLSVTTLLVAGDYGDSLPFPEDRFEVIPVKGNCDQRNLPLFRRIPWSDRMILLTHGHLQISPESLSPGDLFITGHTHIPHLEETSRGVILVNPGSIGLPRGDTGATFALLTPGDIQIRLAESGKMIDHLKI